MTSPRPTFLYDGDCAFCTRCVRLIARWIPSSARIVPWQVADLDALGVSRQAAESAVQWIDGDGRVAAGPEAIARLLRDAGSWWRVLGWLLDVPPVRGLAWPIYRFIARHRDKLPGGTPACALPHAERDRRRADAA